MSNKQKQEGKNIPLFDLGVERKPKRDKIQKPKSVKNNRLKKKLESKGGNEKKVKEKSYNVLIETKKTEKEENSDNKQKAVLEKKFYTVSEFLKTTNKKLEENNFRVKGEVGKFQNRGNYAFFSLKDQKEESTVNCFVWANILRTCGVEITEGMEVMVSGFLQIYERTGSVSFQVKSIELVGEGALKKAFEELKMKLQNEGLFDEDIKKPVPMFPQKIALITSKHGEAINDFNMNIGSFGFEIKFVDSRVEGQRAVFDLISALKFFNKNYNDYDALVLIRGGGSWESLQAFNNEELARTIRDSEIPVISGVGHEGDVTIADLVSDYRASTPTAAAKKISENWVKTREQVSNWENVILNEFDYVLNQRFVQVNEYSGTLKESFSKIFQSYMRYEEIIKRGFEKYLNKISQYSEEIEGAFQKIEKEFKRNLESAQNVILRSEDQIRSNDPKRQLKLGYSIALKDGKVLKSVKNIKKGEEFQLKLNDGEIDSKVHNVKLKKRVKKN